MPEVSPSRYLVTCGWAQVPHISEEAKAELRRSTLPHLRESREFGTPSLGAGAIYPIPINEIEVEPFAIPAFWPRAYALDVGWRFTAAVWGAQNPDDGVTYLYAEHKRREAEPTTHAAAIRARGDWIRGAIDPAARGRGQADGQKLYDMYANLGLHIVPGVNAVEAGIYEVWLALSEGRLKMFRTLAQTKGEYRVYRRDEKGNIVKENDHLMDCVRMLKMTWSSVASLPKVKRHASGASGPSDSVGGY